MSFGTITAQTLTYNEKAAGQYHLSTSTFSDPDNMFRLRAGATRKDGALSCGITRVIEKDVTVGDDVVRKAATITMNIVVPDDGSFTATEIESMITDLDEVLTVNHLNDQLNGRS